MAKKIELKDLMAAKNLDEYVADLRFEEGLALLENLVELVEGGQLPLDQSIESYERGVALIKQLKSLLDGAEERIKVLKLES